MVHITSSLGWLGAVAAFLALAVAGLFSADALRVRAAYLAMEVVVWYAIVPLNAATLASGLVQGLVSPWGLIRHWWVVVKLLLTVLATGLLLLHLQPIALMAAASAERAIATADLRDLRLQLTVDALAALGVLLVTTALSVFKPPGMTRYGWRKQQERRPTPQP